MELNLTLPDVERMNRELEKADGTLRTLDGYVDVIPIVTRFFFRNRENDAWHTLLLNFLFALFAKIRDSALVISSEKANLLLDFERETEEIVTHLLQDEMKLSNYKFRSGVFLYLSEHIRSLTSLGLELSEIKTHQICQVAVIVESHEKVRLCDLSLFLESAFNGGTDRIFQSPHAVEAVHIILESIWGSSLRYSDEQDGVQASIMALNMLILSEKTSESSKREGSQFVKQLLAQSVHFFAICPDSHRDARAKLFEVICMCIICDPSGNLVAAEIEIQFLLHQSTWFFANERRIRSVHFFKAIVLSVNLKLSTVLVTDSDGVCVMSPEEGALEHSNLLLNLVHELCRWIAEMNCSRDTCFVCNIYRATRSLLPKPF